MIGKPYSTERGMFYATIIIIGIAYLLVMATKHKPVPHLDPPVVTVRHECGSELDTATVAALFDTCGYYFRMESVGKCEKAFYIYKKGAGNK